MVAIILYGIKNCDTVKKARRWLEEHAIEYSFHDFRGDGISKTLIRNILKDNELDTVLNKRGTSWRKLGEEEKQVKTKAQVIDLILNNPTIIKRPVLFVSNKYIVGFNDERYASELT